MPIQSHKTPIKEKNPRNNQKPKKKIPTPKTNNKTLAHAKTHPDIKPKTNRKELRVKR
jgi:hypothetical protein